MAATGVGVSVQALDGSSDVAAADVPDGTLPTGVSGEEVDRSAQRPPISAMTQVAAAFTKAADQREKVDAARAAKAKAKAEKVAARKKAEAERQKLIANAQNDPRGAASAMLGEFGWGQDQMSCLDALWTRESGWDYTAENPSSGAYGIPQSLPGSKMGTVAADWQTNPLTQIRWGLGYIQASYGSPCGANSHSLSVGHY